MTKTRIEFAREKLGKAPANRSKCKDAILRTSDSSRARPNAVKLGLGPRLIPGDFYRMVAGKRARNFAPCGGDLACLKWESQQQAHRHQVHQRSLAWSFPVGTFILLHFRYRCKRCGHWQKKIQHERAIVTVNNLPFGVIVRLTKSKCRLVPWPPRSDLICGVSASIIPLKVQVTRPAPSPILETAGLVKPPRLVDKKPKFAERNPFPSFSRSWLT